MWPNIEMDVIMAKLDAVRDIVRIAYGSEGATREKLFSAARDTAAELANMLTAKAPEEMEDDE